MQWCLLAEIDEKEALASLAVIKLIFIIIFCAVPVIMWTVGILVSKAITAPIHRLHRGTETIAEGNLDYKVGTDAKDEIGQLSRAFDQMTCKLKDYHANLDKNVQERTSELRVEVRQRTSAKEVLEQRIKQIDCLYGLSKLVERPKISLEQIFQETVPLIRNAYQHPDVTCVRITFDGIHYKTDNFEKSELSQHAQLKVEGEKAGTIEVYCLGEKSEEGQRPFLEEEHDLLDAVAERLGRITELKQATERLRLFRNLIERSNDYIFVIDAKRGRFRDMNDKACADLGFTRKELLDMTLEDIEEPMENGLPWQERIEELKLKEDIVKESRYRHNSGRPRYYRAKAGGRSHKTCLQKTRTSQPGTERNAV
jgi:PAS domain S-box-containing protein